MTTTEPNKQGETKMKEKSTYELRKGDVVTINDTSKWCSAGFGRGGFGTMKSAEHVVTLRILSNAKFDKGLTGEVCSVFRCEVLDITTTGDVYGHGTTASLWERSEKRRAYGSVAYKKWSDPRNSEEGWHRCGSHRKFTVVEG
jgi:hypothetical protein